VSETERWLRVSASGPVLSALSVGAARAALPGHVDLLGTGATSMLETVLPEGQQRFPGRLEVLAGCEVEKLVCDGDRVTTVAARRGDSRLSIPVEEVVIAAGAITSSALLRKSGLGGDAVGSGVHFNLRAAVTAEFPDVGDEFRGGHGHVYVAPGDPPAYLVEIWPVRPVAQALALPGWFEEH
jgi:choline dehydrogenase-like flavoprotein